MEKKHIERLGEFADDFVGRLDTTAFRDGEDLLNVIADLGYQITKKPDSKFEVGQMVECDPDHDCKRHSEFIGKTAKVISIACDIDGDIVVTAHHETLGYISLREHGFLKVRTEEEKLYDEAKKALGDHAFILDELSTADEAIKILIQKGYIQRPNN